jgi:Zn-dependent protease with chaperone function
VRVAAVKFRRHQEAAEQQTRQLIALFVLVVVGLVVAVNLVLALIFWITVPFARGLPTYFIETNTGLVLLFVLGGCWVESMRLHKGGPHVAELAGARLAQPGGNDEHSRREQRFVNVVQEMAIASGQRPAPQAWVLPRDDAINALAAGWRGEDAVVVVTRGALERLTRAELQGVVAHEFSHIVHGDTRLNMRLVGLVWGLQMIWGLGLSLWSTDELGRRHAGALFGLGLMAVGSLGWLAGRLLQAAVSRQREFLADASAVKFARHVDGLGGALRKIADQQARRVKGLASAHAASLAHLLLSSNGASRGGWRRALATHPPLAERLSRLYGRSFEADEVLLAADRVAMEAADDNGAAALALVRSTPDAVRPEPAVRQAQDDRGHGASTGLARTDGSDVASRPESALHDATQKPAHFDAAERERDALRRIDQWYGIGEWQAAVLALAIDPRAPQAAARWRGYEAATADLHVATAVRDEVQALRASARRQVLQTLLDRVRQSPPQHQRRLLREWSKRRAALASAHPAADQWRALVIRNAFAPARASVARGTLATHAEEVRAATRCMARVLTADSWAQTRWHDAAIAALESMDLPQRRGPGVGLAPPTVPSDRRLLIAALRVRQLSVMQRPLLLRAWLDAAQGADVPLPPPHADALHLLCVALKLPVPDALR